MKNITPSSSPSPLHHCQSSPFFSVNLSEFIFISSSNHWKFETQLRNNLCDCCFFLCFADHSEQWENRGRRWVQQSHSKQSYGRRSKAQPDAAPPPFSWRRRRRDSSQTQHQETAGVGGFRRRRRVGVLQQMPATCSRKVLCGSVGQQWRRQAVFLNGEP